MEHPPTTEAALPQPAYSTDDLLARARRDLDELRLLYETSRQISTAVSVEGVVRAYLEQVAVRSRYTCTVVLYERSESGDRIGVRIVGFWTAASGLSLEVHRLPYVNDGLDPLLDAGQTLTFTNVHTDPRVPPTLREIQARDGRPALAFIPLIVGGDRLGLVILSYPAEHEWQPADLHPYQTTALLLANAIDNQRQQIQLAERQRQLAVLEERRRLARELHDSVTQSLFGMNLLAQALPELWELDRAEALDGLHQIRDLTRSALAEMRALLFELRPAAMGAKSLDYALRDLATSFSSRTAMTVDLTVAAVVALPEPVEQALFRITQEALTNAARHARATVVRLSLNGGPPLRLQISDNGRGFEPAEIQPGRFGLTSIRERAASIGARLKLSSAVGQGTHIIVEWPAQSDPGGAEQQ